MELGCGFGANLELFKQDNAVSGIEGPRKRGSRSSVAESAGSPKVILSRN